MKINSRKLLVFSYAISGELVLYSHLVYLWPELSAGGRRGLIAHLLKQRLISVQYSGKTAQIYLSPIGKAWVEEEYFAEAKSQGPGYLVLIYPEISSRDKKLKELKTILSKETSEIAPHTFYSQFPLSDELLSVLKRRYFSHAAVLSIQEWLCGDAKMFINYYLQKNNTDSLLSGVSTQLNELIDKKTMFSDANHQANSYIFSLFDRLFEIIEEKHHLPGDVITVPLSGRQLLAQFKLLFPTK